jgi:hypothetical protein
MQILNFLVCLLIFKPPWCEFIENIAVKVSLASTVPVADDLGQNKKREPNPGVRARLPTAHHYGTFLFPTEARNKNAPQWGAVV